MERNKTLTEQAADFRDLLAAGRVEEIDFDRLTAWLGEIATAVERDQQEDSSETALRQDYEGRIAGMVKAMAAVDRSGRNHEEGLKSLEQLPGLSGEELVACYRRISAQFRDLFPTTFGHGPFTVRTKAPDLSVYK